MSILMEDPQGSYYATMGRDQLRRLLGDREKRIAELEKNQRIGFKAVALALIEFERIAYQIKAMPAVIDALTIAKQALAEKGK